MGGKLITFINADKNFIFFTTPRLCVLINRSKHYYLRQGDIYMFSPALVLIGLFIHMSVCLFAY